MTKYVCSDNLAQNIWNKLNKSSKIGYNYEAFMSNFEYVLAAIATF